MVMFYPSGDGPFVMVKMKRTRRSFHDGVYLSTFRYTLMSHHEIYDIGTEILLLQ